MQKVRSLLPVLGALVALPLSFLRFGSGSGAALAAPTGGFVIAGDHVGPITAKSSAADLRRIFGAAHVVDKQLPGAESEMVDGSVVYPRSQDSLEIFWADKTHTRISGIRLSTRGGSWRTANGVHIGTSVAELTALNKGKAFHFSGFDWDYGGVIGNWGGGPLEKQFGTKSHVRLQLAYAQSLSEQAMKPVEGEQQVSSANPVVQRLRPYVAQIYVDF